MDYHISKETEDFRNSFLLAEFDYIENELVKDPEFAKRYNDEYRGQDIDFLTRKLQALYKMMEEGKIEEGKEEEVEKQMICCCLAIEDEIKELILVKTHLAEEGITK